MRTLKDLLFYLKHYKKESFFAPLFKLLEATFELIVPLVVARIIDSGIRPGNKTVIYQNCALLVGFAVVGMVMAITAQFFAARAATGFGKELRSSLFGKIQSLSFSELDTLGRSSLITRMTNDVTQTQNGVNLALRLFLRSPFIVLGATVMAFTIDVRCALIFVVVIAALSLVLFGIMGLTMPGYKNVQRQLDGVTLTTRENYAGARVIRAFAAEDAEQAGFNKRNEMLSHLQRSVGRLSALLNPLTYILINIGIVVLIHTGAMRVSLGDLTQGQVVALYNYMSQILVELVKLANMIITITDNGIGMSEEFQKHIFETFERERNTTSSHIEGSGIGMGITKKLVELMDGTIEVKSKQGEGSTFTVTIPCRKASEADSLVKKNSNLC